ncbi:putative chaperonin GroEL [uncultured virus]|uniref:Putative chaperonin GroEL n=1 Tax=uncultured virus TaxID=340016 RepID=A0A218MM91_9VIRU|nr:putative chaperonin GroEL [uncultured virus]
MSKVTIVNYGDDSRKKLIDGVNQLADAVVTTLGPNGRNVVIQNEQGTPQSTKDGVTVAKAIELEDTVENTGAQMVKQAAIKTAEQAGDGTTTSTLLAREIVNAGMRYSDKGHNTVEIKRGIDKCVKEHVNYLREISQDISSEDQLRQVATISANNDEEVGELIATAMEKVGRDGVVTIEESRTGETYLETVEGLQFDRGYKSPYFVTNNDTMSSNLKDTAILFYNGRIATVKDLLPLLENLSQQAKSLLIVAEDIDGEALATLIVNKMRGILNVCAVKAPDFGDRRTLLMNDMAILTGGQVVDKDKGMKLDKFDLNWLGECRTVTVTKESTTIVDGAGEQEAIERLCTELQTQIENSSSPFEVEKLQERLAKLTGGVAVVHVGGNTETEMRERKDRVDDALQATKAAIEEGIIPGGGLALLRAAHNVTCESSMDNNDQKIGCGIVKAALRKPFKQILNNAGVEDASRIEFSVTSGEKIGTGYNIKTGKFDDFLKKGIIDPTKVTRCALENAASIAGTILLTECTVVNKPQENQDEVGAMPGMF